MHGELHRSAPRFNPSSSAAISLRLSWAVDFADWHLLSAAIIFTRQGTIGTTGTRQVQYVRNKRTKSMKILAPKSETV
jgi:hypothetical protein